MKQQLSILLAFALCQQVTAQNIGIGTSQPSRAKLEVHGATGANAAIFGGESSGISLQRNWPGIGFNQYYNNANKYMSAGYAGVQYLDPDFGAFSLDLFGSGAANTDCVGARRMFSFLPSGEGLIGSNYFNANLAVSRGTTQEATSCFFGTDYHSYFNRGNSEDTYIRSGKVNGKVYVNDVAGGSVILFNKVGINTGSPAYPLDILQSGSTSNNRAISMLVPSTLNSWQINVGPFANAGHLYLSSRGASMGYFSETDGTYHLFSDSRLKQHIQPMQNVLDQLMLLKPVTYEMKNYNPTHRLSLGFIAQEVKKVFPDLVTVSAEKLPGYENIDSVHSINYTGFAVVAVKAIQEQQQVIKQLLQENQRLSDRLTTIETLLLPGH